MGQRPQVKRDPDFKAHLGDRLLDKRRLAGKPPPPPPEASKLANDLHAITVSYIRSLGIDADEPSVRARIDIIDRTFWQIVSP